MTSLTPAAALLFALGIGTVAATATQCTDRDLVSRPAGPSAAPERPAQQDPGGGGERIRLLVSGAMLGRLEPCGCASGQLGGLPRRVQHIGEQRDYDLLIEGGDLVEGATELDLLKGLTALQVLSATHPYDAVGVGPNDLALPPEQWAAFLTMVPAVASDLECELPDWPARPFVEKDVRGQLVRIASLTVALPAEPGEGNPAAELPFKIVPPLTAWQRAMADVADSTLRVLLYHGGDMPARDLVPQLEPKPDLVVCFDESHSEPPAQPETVAGVPLVFPGIRGRVMLELTLQRTATGPSLGYSPVPLPASKTLPGGGGDPDTKAMLLQHRQDVAADHVLEKLAEQHPTSNGARYVGSQTCAGCHPSASQVWQQTRHAHAWQTLVDAEQDPKRYGWPVTQYPDCVSCHVVGYGDVSGFVNPKKTPQLTDVGCERCHGAGSDHIGNPAANPLGIRGGTAPSMLCVQCHDFEQSPDFLYGDKWKLIEHGLEPHMVQARKARGIEPKNGDAKNGDPNDGKK
ncbi:MAG: hypothetical protein KDE27_11300 [Planctomycetes bacterium]|nr:hypothetical protein [Planctomycetota bacterium]